MRSSLSQEVVLLTANTAWYLYNFRLSFARSLRDRGYRVCFASPDDPYANKLVAQQFEWYELSVSRGAASPMSEIRSVIELLQLSYKLRPIIIHGFTLRNALYSRIVGIATGIRTVQSIAGLGYIYTGTGIRAGALRAVLNIVLRAAFRGSGYRVIVQNEDDLQVLKRISTTMARRSRLVRGSGVDLREFYPPDERGGAASCRVLMAARLLKDKGLMEFFEAVRILREEGSIGEFLLAGDVDTGNPTAVSSDLVRVYCDRLRIEWVGHTLQMADLLRSVDIFVLPSYREGLSKALLEAAACELALVTTDVPGCRDVVADQESGLLVRPRDAESLADAIKMLIDSPSLRRTLGSAARKRVSTEFSVERIDRETMAVYGELVSPT